MNAKGSSGWVIKALGLLPGPVRRALDDWSAGVAARKASRRREVAASRVSASRRPD